MMVCFDTWEGAGIFMGRMRAEGRHAEILDEGMCFLWGPLAIGGVRVAVSDIVLDEDGEWPEIETTDSELAHVLRQMFIAFACSGPVLLLAILAIERARDAERSSTDPAGVLAAVLLLAGFAGAIAIMGSMMPAFTRFLRDDDSLASRLFRFIIALLLCLI